MSHIAYVIKVLSFPRPPEIKSLDFISPPLPTAYSSVRPELRSLFAFSVKEGRQEARKEEGREGWLMLIVKLIRLRNTQAIHETPPGCALVTQVEQEASCHDFRGTSKSDSSAVSTPLADPNLLLEVHSQ